jgi:hypothetical protein
MTASPAPTPPSALKSVTIARSYREAERAVDWLSDQGFPVNRVQIVGTGLRYVEHVAGRLTTGRAALAGAGYGTMFGLFWGLLFALLFTVDQASFLGVVAYGIVVGAVLGTLFGAIGHYGLHGRRDFASTAETRADRYEVQVDDRLAGEAEDALAKMPGDRR